MHFFTYTSLLGGLAVSQSMATANPLSTGAPLNDLGYTVECNPFVGRPPNFIACQGAVNYFATTFYSSVQTWALNRDRTGPHADDPRIGDLQCPWRYRNGNCQIVVDYTLENKRQGGTELGRPLASVMSRQLLRDCIQPTGDNQWGGTITFRNSIGSTGEITLEKAYSDNQTSEAVA